MRNGSVTVGVAFIIATTDDCLPIRPTPTACRISTASPFHSIRAWLLCFGWYQHWWAMRTVLSRPEYQVWQDWKWNQAFGIHRGHPYRYWPRSLALNQPTAPVLQPPLHLTSQIKSPCSSHVNPIPLLSGNVVFVCTNNATTIPPPWCFINRPWYTNM